MTELLTFAYDSSAVRVIERDGAPWWIAADVAAILGYDHTPSMVRNLDEDEAAVHILHSSGQRREMSIISESGLFAAILKSRKAEARAFRRWVTGEVLPALRRNGHYALFPADPAPPIALDLDPARLAVGVSVVREARRLFGPRAARSLWPQLGLPPCTIDAVDEVASDPIAAPLAHWLADRHQCTIQQAAEGIGMTDIDWSARHRIARLLRLMGWDSTKRRISAHRTANVFTRTASAADMMEAAHEHG